MKTSSTVTIIRMTSAQAATQSWRRCVQPASLTNRSRTPMIFARPRPEIPLPGVGLEELAARLARLVDGGHGFLDVRRHPLLDLGDVGVGQLVDLHALLDEFLAAVLLRRLPQSAV